jgi:hypothetical protein
MEHSRSRTVQSHNVLVDVRKVLIELSLSRFNLRREELACAAGKAVKRSVGSKSRRSGCWCKY